MAKKKSLKPETNPPKRKTTGRVEETMDIKVKKKKMDVEVRSKPLVSVGI